MRRLSGALMLMLTVVQAAGCYSTVPLDTFPPQPGSDVDLQLTTEGTAAMAPILGPKVSGIQGRFVNLQSDSVYLAVSAVSLTNGDSNFWQHERVGIPRPFVSRVALRKFSAGKSGVVAAGIVAGLVSISALVVSAKTGTKGGGPPKGQ